MDSGDLLSEDKDAAVKYYLIWWNLLERQKFKQQ